MGTFKRIILERAALPPLVVEVPVTSWADTCLDKPTGPVEIGLRLISESEAASARSEAAKKAWRAHPLEADEDARVEAYNGALMAIALGRATCQADDINVAFREWPCPADMIALAMTPAGIELLYGHLDTLTMAEAPSMPEASDDDIAAVATALLDGSAWTNVSGAHAHRIRRLLKVCADAITVVKIVKA